MTKKYLKYSEEFKSGDRSVYYRYGTVFPSDVGLLNSRLMYWNKDRWVCLSHTADDCVDLLWCLRPLPPDIERVDSVTKRQIEKALEKEKPKARKRRKRKQWEYFVMRIKESQFPSMSSLDVLGSAGWELVLSYVKYETEDEDAETVFVFKRPKRKVKKSGSRTK